MSDTPYIVSARKYRPATFKSVVGQKNLTETLKNAIDRKRLAQAYLFCGPRGVGKTSCARIFAKTINCLSPTPEGEACGVCESCRAIEEGNSFNIIELDAASNNSVDNIRSLTEQVSVPPSIGDYRVFIIDEVHMLSPAAFNAFLKTLEEPPKYVIFILATTEKHKVIPTILSRCQIYDFKRITIQDMVEHLAYVAQSEGMTADTASLNVIARKADGAMRDALSIFDQVAASSFGNITYERTLAALNVLDYEFYFRLVDAFRAGDIPAALLIYKEIRDRGFDTLFFINGLSAHIRDLMVAFSPQTVSLLEAADDIAARYTEQARSFPVNWLYAAMKILNDCDFNYRTASNKQILTELTLIRLCQLLNPPVPPFDRVDSDNIPIGDIATPHPAAPAQAAPSNVAPPQTASAPTAAPAAATVATVAAPVSRPKPAATPPRLKSVRLSDLSAVDDESSSLERKRQPVTLQQIESLWDEFIARNPSQQILISAMRKARPTQESAECFKVMVDHPAERQAFESAMGTLLKFIREKVSNDYITIIPEVDPSKESLKGLPPHELLKHMIESNARLASFLSEADMEII